MNFDAIYWREMSHGSLRHSEIVMQKWISIEIHQKSKVIASWRPREPTPAAALSRMPLWEVSATAGRLVATCGVVVDEREVGLCQNAGSPC